MPPSVSRTEAWWGSRAQSQEPAIETIKMGQKLLSGVFSLYCIQSREKNLLKLQTMQNSDIFRTPSKPAQIIVHGYTESLF